jgi:hypothetical protein
MDLLDNPEKGPLSNSCPGYQPYSSVKIYIGELYIEY